MASADPPDPGWFLPWPRTQARTERLVELAQRQGAFAPHGNRAGPDGSTDEAMPGSLSRADPMFTIGPAVRGTLIARLRMA